MKFLLCLFFILSNIIFSKNIYVVYDDSLSMKKDNRDIYANYAVQTLAALLSEDDNLTITRMSDIKDDFRNKTVVNLKDIKTELKYFEKDLKAKSQVTPYRSVETIVDYIDKTSSKDESNWLIVITDGQFEDGKPIPNIESIKESITKSVQNSNLKPIFLLIGSNQKELQKHENQKGIKIWKDIFGEGEFPKIYKASNEKDIIVKMREIAELLTSKSSGSTEDIYVIDKNKLTFNSLFPLSKIIFLDQAEGKEQLNTLEKIYINGKEIEVEKQYKPFKNERKVVLAANVVHIDGNNNNIVLVFKNNITKKIKVFPEVSAKFQVTLINEQGEIIPNGLIKTPANEEFKIVAKLIKNSSTELLNHIDGTVVTINYGNKKIPLKYNKDKNFYEGILKIEEGKKSIDGTAEFPGYFYYQSDIYIVEGSKLKVVPKVELPKIETPKIIKKIKEIKIEKPYKLSLDIFPSIKGVVTQEELKSKKFYIIPKVNNKSLSEKEIENIEITYKTDIEGLLSNKKFIVEHKSFGWEFTPTIYPELLNYKNPQGEKIVEVSIGNEVKNKSINNTKILILEKISFWNAYGPMITKRFCQILSLISAIFLILGYIRKNRFKKNEKIVIEETLDDFKKPNQRKSLSSTFMNKLIPYKDDQCNIEGLIYVAHRDKGCIQITADSFNKMYNRSSVNKVYINGDYVDKDELKTGKKEMYRLYEEDSIEFIFDNSRKKYIYKIEK